MTRIKLPGPSYTSQSVNADCQRTVNLYPERIESGDGNTDLALYPTPGLKTFVNLSPIPPPPPPPMTVDGAGTNNGNEPILNVIDVLYAKGIADPSAYYDVPQPPGLDVGHQFFINIMETPVVPGLPGSIIFLIGQTRATWCFGILDLAGTIQAPTEDNGSTTYDQGFTDGLQKWTGAYGSAATFGGAPQPTAGFSSLIQDTITPGGTFPFVSGDCVPYDMELGTVTINNPGAYNYARFNGNNLSVGDATGTIQGVTFTHSGISGPWNLVMLYVAPTLPSYEGVVLACCQLAGGNPLLDPAGWERLYTPTDTNAIAIFKQFIPGAP